MVLRLRQRRNKYSAKPQTVDNIRFASKREARRYGALKLLLRVGEISGLECHPPFELRVNGQKICTYVADFSYLDKAGARVIEDTKGVRTDVFKLKKKLMRAIHGIDVVEV